MKKSINILLILALVLTAVLVPLSAYAATDSEVAMPKFSKKEGTYTKSVKLTLTAEKGAKIYYTTDGSKPTSDSKEYTKAITISKSARVRAIAVKNGKSSLIRSREYTVKVQKPSAEYKGVKTDVVENGVEMEGVYRIQVTLKPMDSKTTMYYTVNGEKPTKKSKKYTGPIYVKTNDTIKVRSYKDGCTSNTVTLNVSKGFLSSLEQQILKDMNEARAEEGLGSLKFDKTVQRGTDIRVEEYRCWEDADEPVGYAHSRPNGDSWLYVYDDIGLSIWTYDSTGEILAAAMNPNGLFTAWMNSAGHKAAILAPVYTHASISVIHSNETYYACTIFHD